MTTEEAGPRRLQRKRSRGWRMPVKTRCVSRPSVYGNPYRVELLSGLYLPWRWGVRDFRGVRSILFESSDKGACSRFAVEMFSRWLAEKMEENPGFLEPLSGYDLACYCAPDEVCHADVLLHLANPGKVVVESGGEAHP